MICQNCNGGMSVITIGAHDFEYCRACYNGVGSIYDHYKIGRMTLELIELDDCVYFASVLDIHGEYFLFTFEFLQDAYGVSIDDTELSVLTEKFAIISVHKPSKTVLAKRVEID